MTRHYSISAIHVLATCIILLLFLPTAHSLAKETDPGGKDADTETEIVFEPTSEGDAAKDPAEPERPISFDSKRPSILGMTVVEGDDGKALVVDVGASSPAWDAGIRNDDIIVSLHGVKSGSFQEWADNVRKVVTDAKAGQTIPIQVLRDGKPLDLQARISEQKGKKPPRPLRERRQEAALNQAAPVTGGEQVIQPGGVPYPVGGGGGVGLFADDDSVVDDGVDGAPVHAAAQLMAVNHRAGTAPAPTAPTDVNATSVTGTGTAPGTFPTTSPSTGTGRGATGTTTGTAPGTFGSAPGAVGTGTGTSGQIGTAQFSDDSGGMMAFVTLSGLPPGSYRVGIGQFSGGAGFAPGANSLIPNENLIDPSRRGAGDRNLNSGRPITPPGTQPPVQPPGTSPIVPYGGRNQPGAPNSAPGQAPSGAPGAGGTPGTGGAGSGGGGGNATGSGAARALPQYHVLAQVTPAANNQSNPVAGRNAAGRTTTPTNPTPNGAIANPNNSSQTRPLTPDEARLQANQQGGGAGGQFGIDLGVVNVQGNGGQLQQRLEGIRVANVIGQSVLVVPANAPVTGTAPTAQTSRNQRGTTGMQGGSLGVVATGVIQLVSSGQPANRSTGATQAGPGTSDTRGTTVPPTETGARPPLQPSTQTPASGQTPATGTNRNTR